ncbi:MAG: hypothetical protein KBT68_07395, partial [bacterium]|nr:hypothetical protein [Candidatus Colisoma equi]
MSFDPGAGLQFDAQPAEVAMAQKGLVGFAEFSGTGAIPVTIVADEGWRSKELTVPLVTASSETVAALKSRFSVNVRGVADCDLAVSEIPVGGDQVCLCAVLSRDYGCVTVERAPDGEFVAPTLSGADVGEGRMLFVNGGAPIEAQTSARDFTIAKLASDVRSDFDEKDVLLSGFSDGLVYLGVKIEEGQGGIREIKLTTLKRITYVAKAGWNYPGYLIGTDKAQNGDFMWSDEKPAHDNADYLI